MGGPKDLGCACTIAVVAEKIWRESLTSQTGTGSMDWDEFHEDVCDTNEMEKYAQKVVEAMRNNPERFKSGFTVAEYLRCIGRQEANPTKGHRGCPSAPQP